MAGPRWTFTDQSTNEVYLFPINPNSDGVPQYTKQITSQPTAAPGGRVLIFEGNSNATPGQMTGTLLYEDQYNAFMEWFNKRHQVLVTDDLGRQFSIYIISFEPKRKFSASHPWRHDYTIKYLLVDWP